MTIPNTNYLGLHPIIKIYDWENTLVYKYEHPTVKAGAVQEFELYRWDLKQGINNLFGSMNLSIHDHENVLTDQTSSSVPSKLMPEYRLTCELGKNAAGLSKWFEGRLKVSGIRRGQKQQHLEVYCEGMGTHMNDRYTKIEFQQAREAVDALTLDGTDTSAKVSEIAKKMLTDASTYLHPNLPVLPFTVNGIVDRDIKISNFVKLPFEKISTALTELANYGGCIFGVDYSDMDVWMRPYGSKSSGMLFTNDHDSLKTTSWNPDKIGILKRGSRLASDSSISRGFGYINAYGALFPKADMDNTASNAALDLSAKHTAIEFTPTQDNIWIVFPFLARNGTPVDDLHICLIGADGLGKPATDTIHQRHVIPKETLNAAGSGKYVNVELQLIGVVPGTKLFIYFEKYPDATNNIELDYQTGSGEYWTSDDGTTWNDPASGAPLTGKLVGTAKMRIYSGKKTIVEYENTVLSKKMGNPLYPKELNIPVNDMHVDSVLDPLVALSSIKSRPARFYEPIEIYAPVDPIPLGQTVNLVDRFNKMNVTAEITSYSLGADAYSNVNGAQTITVEIQEVLA